MSLCASIQRRPIFWFWRAVKFGDSRDCSGSDGMVAAKHEGNLPCFEGLENEVGALGAGGGDFLQIFRVGRAFFFLLGKSDGNIAAVFDVMADGLEAGLESGDAHGGGTHVDAAAGLSQVKRHSDDANFARNDAAEFSGLSHSGSSCLLILLQAARYVKTAAAGLRTATDTGGTAFGGTGWFRERARGRRSRLRRVRCPCRSRRGARCRICADRDTT